MGEAWHIFRGQALPELYLFPRSKQTLFDYARAGSRTGPRRTGEVRIQDPCPSFSDSGAAMPEITDYETGGPGPKLKEIDFRLYADLWNRSRPAHGRTEGREETETRKRMTLCFLRREGWRYYSRVREDLRPRNAETLDRHAVMLRLDGKSTGKRFSLSYTTGRGNRGPVSIGPNVCGEMEIPVRDFDETYMLEFEITLHDSTRDLPENGEFEVETWRKDYHGGWKNRISLSLHRHGGRAEGGAEDPFGAYRRAGAADSDFFVIPRVNATESQRPLVRRLQVYSNQVLARNRRLGERAAGATGYTGFRYVAEDGVSADDLARNLSATVPGFQETVSGVDAGGLRTSFNYRFSGFGQADKLAWYLAGNYGLAESEARGLVIDRHYVYGEWDQADTNAGHNFLAGGVETPGCGGLETLYRMAAGVFRERFVAEAEKYVNFQPSWRVPPEDDSEGTGEGLSTYIGGMPAGITDRDREALEAYGTQNGVPYFETTEDGTAWGGKCSYDTIKTALQTCPANWNLYPDGSKPCRPTGYKNTAETGEKGVGLDCSGLVTNCLRDTLSEDGGGQAFFNAPAGFEEQAFPLGSTRARAIPLDLRAGDNGTDTLIQSGDLIYTKTHITLCAVSPETHVTASQVTPNAGDYRYFTIIHNYGEEGLHLNLSTTLFTNGFFKKTLKGPFRHWGSSF
jgi:hypothetical protein